MEFIYLQASIYYYAGLTCAHLPNLIGWGLPELLLKACFFRPPKVITLAYLFIAFQVSAVWQSLFVYCIPGFSRVAKLICLLHSRFQPCGRAHLFIAFQVSAVWQSAFVYCIPGFSRVVDVWQSCGHSKQEMPEHDTPQDRNRRL